MTISKIYIIAYTVTAISPLWDNKAYFILSLLSFRETDFKMFMSAYLHYLCTSMFVKKIPKKEEFVLVLML